MNGDILDRLRGGERSHEGFRSAVETEMLRIVERLELAEKRLGRLEDADWHGKSFERRVVDAVIDKLNGVEFDE